MHRATYAILAAVATVVSLSTPAQAASESSVQGSPSSVILNASTAVHFPDGSTFYPTGKISAQTLIITPDVPKNVAATLAARAQKVSAKPNAAVAAAASSCWTSFAAPLGSGWSREYSSPCSVIGSKGYNETYAFYVDSGTNQQACVQVKGFEQGYNGSVFGLWAKWYVDASCARASGPTMRFTVPWGNIAAVPKLKAMSPIASQVALGQWS